MTDLLSSPVLGELRPDWSWLDGSAPDPQVLADARQSTQTLLADHGVTYAGDDRWRLDPAPVIVQADEWRALERGLVQRSQLLDAVLGDLYGARRLLADTLLPPLVVLSHPGFVRAVDQVRLPWAQPRQLVLAATDVVRDSAGVWCAVSDRTQAASGAGYAMEDRRVVAQVLAGPYRQAPIARLGPFFHALRVALHDVAPGCDGSGGPRADGPCADGPRADGPRAVLLTDGPDSATAFDQAYLAAMLGLPLVQGSDLVVRSGRLWMRGLEGPEPVDVVLRRVDAHWCDPLDLVRESRIGVPGLVRAVRAGTVSVVNPLGASVLESPALAAYLPRLAREVLGTDLELGSAPTWWCGDPVHLSHVLARLDDLVLVPSSGPCVAGAALDTASRDRLVDQVRAEPWAWTAQEPAGPADTNQGPAAAVLRTFAVAHDESYQVMAGGLARVWSASDAPPTDTHEPAPSLVGPPLSAVHPVPSSGALRLRATHAPSQGRPVAKDVWVLTADRLAPDDESGPVHETNERGPAGLSPRTAENLYWMGRYAERAEAQTRLLRAVVDRWDDYHTAPRSPGGQALHVLLRAVVHHDDANPATLRDLVHDATAPRSVAFATDALARAAQGVRDQLSTDTFGPLARIDRALAEPDQDVAPDGADPSDRVAALVREGTGATSGLRPVLDTVLESLLAVAGIAAEGLVRDAGWRFLDAGRRIERAQHIVDTLASTTVRAGPPEVDRLVSEAVLEVHESTITHRRRYPTTATVPALLDLLVHDDTNPRSLAFSTARLREDLQAVPSRRTDRPDHLLRDVAGLETELDAVVADSVSVGGRRERLAESLGSMSWRLEAAHDEIERLHFQHTAPQRTQTDLWGRPNVIFGGGE
ncbi:MAG: circularly permuted type 2 ATP-grasp protein [Micrococcales bacterium]|nr:circularly permuted type 2 ATP-grasp protein [Micrococcales bacterium]MCL2668127.1 circularly permuted type 2 ATP-grasp protein [Micrococcales bacterium]